MARRIAPQVTVDMLDGARAYLIGWQRWPVAEGGGWAARLAWVEMTPEGAWITKGGLVRAEAVHRIPGEDYGQVPRDPRPRDPFDPRDADHRRRPHWDADHDGVEPDF